MPRIKLTKSAIDALRTPEKDMLYWDSSLPGFGVKVTPKGRKVFIVLYRVAGTGSRLRKYTIGPYGRITLHQARLAAQKVFAAKLEGRDPATEKRNARQREVTDRVDELLEAYITQHVSQNRSAGEISRLLRRKVSVAWGARNISFKEKQGACRRLSSGRRLRGSDSQGRQACPSAGRAIDQIQSEHREGARHRSVTDPVGPRGRGDRIEMPFAAVHESTSRTKRDFQPRPRLSAIGNSGQWPKLARVGSVANDRGAHEDKRPRRSPDHHHTRQRISPSRT